jgi:hypothetical protein
VSRLRTWAFGLLPDSERGWAEAVVAEAAGQAPGRARLGWVVGGLWAVSRLAVTARRGAKAAVFVVAAMAAVAVAWTGDPGLYETWLNRFEVVTTVLVLAVLPALAHLLFGTARAGWVPRGLRVGTYGAVLALLAGKARIEQLQAVVPVTGSYRHVYEVVTGSPDPEPSVFGTVFVLTMELAVLAVVLGAVVGAFWVTSTRSGVTTRTLRIGVGFGLALGLVMFVVAPLGLTDNATNPWLPGSRIDPLILLAWILLLVGPCAAAVLAGRGYAHGRATSTAVARESVRQGVVAGTIAGSLGALVVTTLGTCTIITALGSDAVRDWLSRGPHLTGLDAYAYELTLGTNAWAYGALILTFPAIGFLVGGFVAQSAWGQSSSPAAGDGGGPGGGRAGPVPARGPTDGRDVDTRHDPTTTGRATIRQSLT